MPWTVDHERVGSFYNPLHRAARHREAAAAPAAALLVRARAGHRELRSAGAAGMADDGKPRGGARSAERKPAARPKSDPVSPREVVRLKEHNYQFT